uniref:PABC domain-containing protein n=1 Tax=Steinernema glaseri TaxID=37863 RepID=A0A1I7Y2V0_9BILA
MTIKPEPHSPTGTSKIYGVPSVNSDTLQVLKAIMDDDDLVFELMNTDVITLIQIKLMIEKTEQEALTTRVEDGSQK